MYATMLGFSHGAWGPNSEPNACAANTVLAEPSPQPQGLKYFPSSETLRGLWDELTTQFIDTGFQLALFLMPQLPLK